MSIEIGNFGKGWNLNCNLLQGHWKTHCVSEVLVFCSFFSLLCMAHPISAVFIFYCYFFLHSLVFLGRLPSAAVVWQITQSVRTIYGFFPPLNLRRLFSAPFSQAVCLSPPFSSFTIEIFSKEILHKELTFICTIIVWLQRIGEWLKRRAAAFWAALSCQRLFRLHLPHYITIHYIFHVELPMIDDYIFHVEKLAEEFSP